MIRFLLRIFLIIILILIGFISYFSLIGFETNKFNDLIKNNLKQIDSKIDVKLNDVKLLLNLSTLNLDIKTLGPILFYDKKKLELEFIKSKIPISSLIQKNISSSNISISTKLVQIHDVISFIRSAKKNYKMLILNNLIDKGFLIANLNFNFDHNGNLKDDYKIEGLIKNSRINYLDKKKVNNINLKFNILRENIIINDLNLSFENIKFVSDKLSLIEKNNKFFLDGNFKTLPVTLNEQEINNLSYLDNKLNIKKIKFSSKNYIKASFNENIKLDDYELRSNIDLNKLRLKNILNLDYFFSEAKDFIQVENHKVDLIFKKNFFEMTGLGKILIQNYDDNIEYKLTSKNDIHNFNTKLIVLDNPISIDFLNFKKANGSKSNITLKGSYKNRTLLKIDNLSFSNGQNNIIIKDLRFSKNNKISSVKKIDIDIQDSLGKKNIFFIEKNKNEYTIFGDQFNATNLINDLIKKSNKEKINKFDQNFKIKLKLKEVLIDENEKVVNLNGNISISNNSINKANLKASFSNNQNISFTILTKDEQQVTTFFSDKAKPFINKFNFIKGFDEGSLDFYSVKKGKQSNSQIKIYDFKLKEVPALTKILTLASLQGIADLLSGDGIRFDDFEMKFENNEDLMNINEIYAIGPTISILMEAI